MINTLLGVLAAFGISVAIVPVIMAIERKSKTGQPILSYVDNHASKSGTPTFGGISFIVSTLIVTLLFLPAGASLALLCAVVVAAYGVVGFLDDFLKTKSKQNQGLTPWQKIVFQAFISLIVSTFAYASEGVGNGVYLPFTLRWVDLGIWVIPFDMFLFLAFTNAVNLTDGLDGLAGKTSVVYLLGFAAVTFLTIAFIQQQNPQVDLQKNLVKFALFFGAAIGGFLVFNAYPAKIFMGDTGSLGIGAGIGALAVLSGLSLYAPLIGIVFVWTCVSDVVQVAYFKRTKKRVFLMAPFHHHLERKGWHENKIVTVYVAITFCVSLVVLILTMLGKA